MITVGTALSLSMTAGVKEKEKKAFAIRKLGGSGSLDKAAATAVERGRRGERW